MLNTFLESVQPTDLWYSLARFNSASEIIDRICFFPAPILFVARRQSMQTNKPTSKERRIKKREDRNPSWCIELYHIPWAVCNSKGIIALIPSKPKASGHGMSWISEIHMAGPNRLTTSARSITQLPLRPQLRPFSFVPNWGRKKHFPNWCF